MGSDTREETQTTTRQPFEGTQGLLQNILSQAGGLPSSFTPLSGTTQQGLAGLEGLAGQQLPSAVGGATQFAGDFLGGPAQTGIETLQGTAAGDLVTSNPALLQALEAQREPVTSNILGRFAAAGRSGLNPAVARAITEAQTRAELPLIAQDISTQQARQQQAAQSLFGGGQNLAQLTPGLQAATQQEALFGPNLLLQAGGIRDAQARAQANAPFIDLMRQLGFAQPIAGLGGTATQTQEIPTPSPFQTALGAGLSLGGAFLGGPSSRGLFGGAV